MISGYKLQPIKGQLYEIKGSCGRIMGVARFVEAKHIEGLKLSEFYFKPIFWYLPFTSPFLIFRLNHRGAGSLSRVTFKEINPSELGSYKNLLEIK